MIARASSGSRSRSSSVEPLMSANNAVTVLRSPSRFSGVGASATRTVRSMDFLVVGAAVDPIGRPHFLQNRAPGLITLLHAGQVSPSFEPHCSQNAASDGLSVLHETHSIDLSAEFPQERLGLLQVGGVEAFGEPVVHFGQ